MDYINSSHFIGFKVLLSLSKIPLLYPTRIHYDCSKLNALMLPSNFKRKDAEKLA
jgi:hypothetical protein